MAINETLEAGRRVDSDVSFIPTGMKVGYSVGDFGANLVIQTVGIYLMFFFTDVFGIVPALAGAIFLYSKMWEAVSNPLMGVISDHTDTRWGKKRPYLLFGAVPLGAAVFLLFFSPAVAPGLRFTWGLVTFLIFCTTLTVVNVPYLAITPTLTLDFNERSVVTGIRAAFAIGGALVAAGATLPLVGLFGGGDPGQGFRMVGLTYGIVVAVVTVITFLFVRERVREAAPGRLPFRENLRTIVSNRPFLILTAGMFMHMVGMNIMAIVVSYYFKYNLGAEKMIPVAFICLFVTAAFSLPLFVRISKGTSKKFAYNLGMGIAVGVLVLLFFFGERSIYLTLGLFVMGGVGLSTNWLSPWAMIPDTVEYSELKTGHRREGTLYGTYYFFFKIGMALAGFIAGEALAIVGFAANTAQSPGTLLGIRTTLTLVPIVFLVLGITCISLYPIDEATHRKVLDELDRRKEGQG